MSLSYASLADIKEEVKTNQTVDDAIVINYGRRASQRIDRLFQSDVPFFFPTIKTRAIRVSPDAVNSDDGTLSIPYNMLELTSLNMNDTAVTTVEVYPPYTSPTRLLRLTGSDSWCYPNWYSYQSCNLPYAPIQAIVAGVWGFHRDYANAWLSITTLTTVFIATTTQTTFTVASIADLSPGQMIKVESEYMEVVSVSVLTVTVKRGINGSTAAIHNSALPLYVWQVEEPIRRAVQRQAAFMYARKGTYESAVVSEIGLIQFPADLLSEVYGVVSGYAYS
jgi:hypothetical protein